MCAALKIKVNGMGGGLFGTHLALNEKCLVFSALILCVYWLPHPKSTAHSIVMGFLLATSAYILLAWYDTIYDCKDRLKPTLLSWFSKPFKPKDYQQQYEELPEREKKIIRTVDIAVLSIVAITFLYPFMF